MKTWTVSEHRFVEGGYKVSLFTDFDAAKRYFFGRYSALELLVKDWHQDKTPVPLPGGQAINSSIYLEAFRDKRRIYSTEEETVRVRLLCEQIKHSGDIATHGIDWLYFTEIGILAVTEEETELATSST